jgi:malonyl-CoA decarboxylase
MSRINIFQDLMPSLKRGSWAPSYIRKHLFGDETRSIAELCRMTMLSDGEYSSLLLSDRILNLFEKLDPDGVTRFFQMLNDEYDLDLDSLKVAVDEYTSEPSAQTLRKLTMASEPGRQELFRRLNLAPGGTRRLVKMRERLLELTQQHPELGKMDTDFRHLFKSWFNRGFLLMQPIDWTTSAHILEKIIAYEAVHEIRNWGELRSRLEPEDRYCYAFFHPAMEDEPLVFVVVALTERVPDRISQILNSDQDGLHPDDASCAIFYSISNCHAGLAGVSFGNFLIKQVADSLKQRFPNLKKFSTISPAPGFRKWLQQASLEDEEIADLLRGIDENPDSVVDTRIAKTLPKLAASYFLEQKTSRDEPLDPVARFHLKNGAVLDRLNFQADQSEKGMEQSLGLMVNYGYDLSRVEENHENYMKNHKVVCSNQVRKLLAH